MCKTHYSETCVFVLINEKAKVNVVTSVFCYPIASQSSHRRRPCSAIHYPAAEQGEASRSASAQPGCFPPCPSEASSPSSRTQPVFAAQLQSRSFKPRVKKKHSQTQLFPTTVLPTLSLNWLLSPTSLSRIQPPVPRTTQAQV